MRLIWERNADSFATMAIKCSGFESFFYEKFDDYLIEKGFIGNLSETHELINQKIDEDSGYSS